MKVNGWVLAVAGAAALGSIAQAQIAPQSSAGASGKMVDPEVIALRNEVATLKTSVAGLKTQLDQLEAKYKSHKHCTGVNPMAACPKTFTPTY